MSGKIELTKELMLGARDYIPLAEKEAWVAENAPKCFDQLAITADDEAMPPMFMVNTGLKSRYLMAALVRLYFRVDAGEDPSTPALRASAQNDNKVKNTAQNDKEEKRSAQNDASETDEWLMSVEEYDAWAGSHVFNQLERWKRDGDLKFKAYDLLYDYKDLEKRFSAQISSLLAVQNDPVIRQAQQMTASVKELPVVLEQLKALQEENKDGEYAH